ncbi:MAG: type III PLP-dependent enzyme [Candidatus Rokuibacteriota bacterium]
MDTVARLIGRNFPGSGPELLVGGCPVTEVAARHGTPLYVYDPAIIDRQLSRLRHSLPPGFLIYYSVKANPNRALLRHFLSRDCGLEVASGGELAAALGAGCAADRIFFAGPGKTEDELEEALVRGVGEIHVESVTEARRIGAIAGRRGIRARAALRVNPGAAAQGGAMRMGGKPAPFGVDEERLEETLDLLEGDAAVQLQGLHLFTGTQILDHAVVVDQYRHGLQVARRVAGRLGRPLHTLDFGGGFGIPYFANETELDVDKLREELRALFIEVEGDPLFRGTRFVVEPGRYLVGEAGIFVTRVTDIKVSRGKTFLITDGGMNNHLAASGNLGQVIKRNYPIAIAGRLAAARTVTVDVVGPLCTPLDTLARDVSLPPAEIGDLVVIFQSGAYGLTASPVLFLGHAVPAEVLATGGRSQVIRPRAPFPAALPPEREAEAQP